MKKCILLLTALFLLTNSLPSVASEEVAIINIKKIVDESLAAKDVNRQIEIKRKEFKAEIVKEEEALRNEDQELAKQRTILSKDAFDKRAAKFKNKVIKAQQFVQSRRSSLENAYVDGLSKIKDSVLEIIADISKARNISIALPESFVLYSDESLNISDEVLKKLNKILPSVKVVVKEATPEE